MENAGAFSKAPTPRFIAHYWMLIREMIVDDKIVDMHMYYVQRSVSDSRYMLRYELISP